MIHVVDAMCGSGKSSGMFKRMKENPDKRYLYITPFLSEIEERIPRELPELKFKSPENRGEGKIADFYSLIEKGKNVAATHVLFGMFTDEVVDMLVEKGYTLVIDEAIQCIGLLDNELKESDAKALKEGEFVIEDTENRGKLYWNEEKYPEHDGKYGMIRNLCNMGALYCFDEVFLMFEYPPRLLRELVDVYVLTYLFKGSDFRCWLELNDISYQMVDTEEFGLIPEEQIKEVVRQNLTIIDNRTLNKLASRQKAGAFSKTWFNNVSAEDLKKYKAVMRSTVVSCKAKSGDIFWTTYKDQQGRLAGQGYTKGASVDMPAFLPCNTRATNKYKDYTLCMYACNIFKNPIDERYMRSQGVEPDADTFALSEMIQFIWRGSIRQGKPMKVLILSKRMRKLLEDWLNEQ